MSEINNDKFKELREKAVEKINASDVDITNMTKEDTEKLIHELKVHQVELEMQNEELRDTQGELETSRDRFSRLFHQSPVGYVVVTDSGLITMANNTFMDMLQVKTAAMYMKPFTDFLEEQSKKVFLGRFNAFFVSPEGKTLELQMKRGDGSTFYGQLQGRVPETFDLRDAKHSKALLLIVTDITEKKTVEEEREELRDQLLHSQKLEAIGQMAGGIAHDFNNMLAIIMGNAGLALSKMNKNQDGYFEMTQIMEASRRAREITMKLLTFARKDKISVSNTYVDSLIEDLMVILNRSAVGNIKINVSCQKNIVVYVDRNQIFQALLNICNNAIDAMPAGGELRITCSIFNASEKKADLFGSKIKKGMYCEIIISDSGIGIPASLKKKVFDPFFTTKSKDKGTGLGLSVTMGIIQNHDGYIFLQSEPGMGTSFHIYLPLSEDRVVEEDDSLSEPEGGSEKILVVDDEIAFLRVAEEALRKLGYDVEAAENGEKGLEAFKSRNGEFDLVVIDMIMPGMDGKELFNEIRKINEDVKILISSGHSASGKTMELLSSGCCEFIQKPYTIQEFCGKARQILDMNSTAED